MVISDQDILKIINASINADEHSGEQSGGSGHIADIGYRVHFHRIDRSSDEHVEVTYYYTLSVCSEFNVYPENPPREYFYKKTIGIDKKLNFETLSQKDFFALSELPFNISWPLIQNQILQYTELYLFRIEWKYGDCRAPFSYPPLFSLSLNAKGENIYSCRIECEERDQPIYCNNPDPVKLKDDVINTIIKRFGDAGVSMNDEMMLPE